MELIRGLHNIRPKHKGCVLTIGNFDGVHLGHQDLLQQLRQKSLELGLPTIVVIFEPQPLELFSPDNAPARLTCFRDKYIQLAQTGIDYLLCVNFSRHFADIDAETFIKSLLIEKLDVKYIAVGDDFHFGARRSGNSQKLKQFGKQYGFCAINTESFVCDQGRRISSTAIRHALFCGDLKSAEFLLGRPYSISGRVIYGDALGRTIGFPTANIPLYKQKSPINGVFAVEVLGCGNKVRYGVANVGIRPTVLGKKQLLEVHIFDFQQDLYGHHINVVFKEKIRDEQKFTSLDNLKRQIEKDVATARLMLSK